MQTPDRPDPGHVLTWRQRKMLRFIRDATEERGYPPSMAEIAAALGLASISSVSYQLARLQSMGYLRRDGRKPRTAKVRLPGSATARGRVGPGPAATRAGTGTHEVARVPLLGRLAAGVPLLAEEQVDDVLPLSRKVVGEGALFAVMMAGDSMVDAAILDGDWVVVREQPDAVDGDIVAAVLGGAITVRRFRRDADHIWLMPHNPAYLPIPGDDAAILGKVAAVLRRLWTPASESAE